MDTTLTDPLVGRVLDHRYRVEARLARGGMATVYTATDVRLERTVAVKVMHQIYAGDPDFVARFIREAKAAARLSHANVVGVYDQGTEDDDTAQPVVFLVMEYVAGRTLRDLIGERGRVSPAHALEVLEPVLAALGAAHAAGLVHRDVKPENVLLADDGRIKVADFGLARAVEAANATQSVSMLIGTVAYLAPEQVATGAADARSDVYAAGIVLYELLTGRPPFDGDTALAVAFRHVHEDVPSPSAVRAVPGPVDDLVARATARDPGTRFADAHEFLGALRRVRAVIPITDPAEGDTAVLRRDGGARRTVRHPTLVTPLPGAPAASAAASAPTAPAAPIRRRRAHRGRLVALLLILLTVAAAVAGWWLAIGRFSNVPSVLALTRATAQQRLDGAGLRAHWLPDRFDATVPAGQVAYEQPGPGARVLHGGAVDIALSKGPEVHRLADLAGQPLDQAQEALGRDNLRSTVAEAYSDSVAAGSVVKTSPKRATLLHPGDLVTLTVSRGRQPIPVPDVADQALGDAKGTLTKLGFTVTTKSAFNDVVGKGKVIRQSPPTGGTAPHGSRIALVVSRGPQLFPVPPVKGLGDDSARRVLEAAGFEVRIVRPLFFGGTVRGQSPSGGQSVPRGTTVTIVVLP